MRRIERVGGAAVLNGAVMQGEGSGVADGAAVLLHAMAKSDRVYVDGCVRMDIQDAVGLVSVDHRMRVANEINAAGYVKVAGAVGILTPPPQGQGVVAAR